jgi:hypothetical protein
VPQTTQCLGHVHRDSVEPSTFRNQSLLTTMMRTAPAPLHPPLRPSPAPLHPPPRPSPRQLSRAVIQARCHHDDLYRHRSPSSTQPTVPTTSPLAHHHRFSSTEPCRHGQSSSSEPLIFFVPNRSPRGLGLLLGYTCSCGSPPTGWERWSIAAGAIGGNFPCFGCLWAEGPYGPGTPSR